MNVTGIDNMLAQMRTVMAAAHQGVTPLAPPNMTGATGAVGATNATSANTPTDFASVLKSSINDVAQRQNSAKSMQQAFVMGDNSVSLGDVMINSQKANIAFQTTVQVRNKVIAAYNDIMNMQV